MTTAPEATPAPKKPTTKTDYRVLTKDDSGYWTEVGVIASISAERAVRDIAGKLGEGTYLAVPERSWKPVTVTLETQTVVKLG